MSTLMIQRMIATPFLVLGGWALLFPGMVERMTLTPAFQHNTPTSALLIGCFGAQAVLSGLFVAFSRFTKTTFLTYAIALVPFFGSITGSCSSYRCSMAGSRSTSSQT